MQKAILALVLVFSVLVTGTGCNKAEDAKLNKDVKDATKDPPKGLSGSTSAAGGGGAKKDDKGSSGPAKADTNP